MLKLYRSYHIRASAELDIKIHCWIPHAVISLASGRGHPIMGPKNVFKNKEAAEGHAVQMAKWWIDDEMSGARFPRRQHHKR